ERDPAAGAEHPEELPEGGLLVGDVDQHRAGRDDVDRLVLDWPEIVRRSLDEAAPVGQLQLVGPPAAEVEQVSRDVGEDDAAGAALERADGDEALAAADVEKRLAGREAAQVENALAPACMR